MLAATTHDECAEQQFVVALKSYVFGNIEPKLRNLTNKITGGDDNAPLKEVRRELAQHETYQNWVSMMRSGQELMWQAAGDCVDRQRESLEETALSAPDKGSVRLDPEFEEPRYLAARDTHMMPGGYYDSTSDRDIRQGAVYDRASSLYSLGRQGGELSDMRGHTIVAHLYERFPEFTPTRILDMGCTIGSSTVAVAKHFPEAEFHAIDVGAGVLRYARARAAYLGASVHFSQQSAEETDFEDGSFDFICSSAMLHETSHKAVGRIFSECSRLLRPGGIMIHLEVPVRAESVDIHGLVRGDYEARYNNEPFWQGIAAMDLAGIAKTCGFVDIAADYQDGSTNAQRGAEPGFRKPNKGPYRSWYLVSGVRGDD
jgi:ubiquinone/menaquinone biosynthesis C-methylase UbiE